MIQGSPEWHAMRKTKIGSSDAPIIMGVSPYMTPYQLWLVKTSRVADTRESNWAIERGKRFEPAARARYNLQTGLRFVEDVIYHPKLPLVASLDGYSHDRKIILEIKIPGKEVFEAAKEGRVHEKYIWQVYHQLMVTGADECHFLCCWVEKIGNTEQITDQALVIVKPNQKKFDELLEKEKEFWKYVTDDIEPPLSPADTVLLEDQQSCELFSRIKTAKVEMKAAEEAMAIAAKRLSDAENRFKILKIEAIEHVAQYEHTKFCCLDVLMYKTKKGWTIKPGHFEDTVESSNEAPVVAQA